MSDRPPIPQQYADTLSRLTKSTSSNGANTEFDIMMWKARDHIPPTVSHDDPYEKEREIYRDLYAGYFEE